MQGEKIGEKPWVCWGSSFTIENKVILGCQNEKEGLMSALTLILTIHFLQPKIIP